MKYTSDARSGASLVEALVALLLGLFLLQLALATLARFRSTQLELAERTDALVAMRVARHVLRRELRHGVPGRDWLAYPDSLALRAFRGTGIVCANDSISARLVVWYRGERSPDPTKDSVLLVRADGSTEARALLGTGSASAPCSGPTGGVTTMWTLDRGAGTGTLVARVFERGSYHLALSALRYRRGPGGRQPLTPEAWSSATAWSTLGQRLGVDLVPARPAAAWSGFLAWRTP